MATPRWQFIWMDYTPYLETFDAAKAAFWPEGGRLKGGHDYVMEFRLNNPYSLSFSMNGLHPDNAHITEMATDIVCRLEGVDLLRTRITNSTDNIGHTKHGVNYTGYDYKEVLNRRLRWPTAADFTGISVNQEDDAWSLILSAQDDIEMPYSDLGIGREPIPPTGISRDVVVPLFTPVSQAITENYTGVENGFDWEITPSMFFQVYYPQMGTAKDTVLQYRAGRPNNNIISFNRTWDPGEFANATAVIGKDGVYSYGSGVLAGDLLARGIWANRVSATEYESVNQTNARFDYEQALHHQGKPTYSVTLAANAWTGPDFLWLGDVVTLDINSGRLNFTTTMRVYGLTINVNDNGGDRVVVHLNNYPGTNTITRSNRNNLRRLRNLES